MTDITHILSQERTRNDVPARSRKRVLEKASDLLCEGNEQLSGRTLFDELLARERLGSTGLGDGVAIPHCRIACDEIRAAFLKLKEPIDYDAPDGQPVDLLFVFVVPTAENHAHLEVLADLARIFGEPDNRARLRRATSSTELYEELIGLIASLAA
ncbi:MAG: PTS fructose transporter subunit IIA [Gammaproteobacteria bacterium]|nr:MAG: PTS fructose transporter subunit IIA [Gammaproteobacteria bacterium]